jgi:hypothetical protein
VFLFFPGSAKFHSGALLMMKAGLVSSALGSQEPIDRRHPANVATERSANCP